MTPDAPGSAQSLYLVVADIVAARDHIVARGVRVGEVFHQGAPGAQFASASELTSAILRAALAHGEHEESIGHQNAEWPVWYAAYMVAEQAGNTLPQ